MPFSARAARIAAESISEKSSPCCSFANLNGADEVYETPVNSDIVVDTERESVPAAVQKIVEYLKEVQCAI